MQTDPHITDPKAKKADNPFALTARYVAGQVDQSIAEHVLKHYDNLESPAGLAAMRAQIDFQPEHVQPIHIIERVGTQREYFAEYILPTIHDMPTFYEACLDYVDTQLDILFFWNNDLLSARISKDYIISFVEASHEALKAQNLLRPEDEKTFKAIRDYAEHGLRSYEMLRHYMQQTEETKGGLIHSVLAQHGVRPQLSDGTHIIDVPEKFLPLIRDGFRDVMNTMGVYFTEDQEPHPALFSVAHTAIDLGARKTALRYEGKRTTNARMTKHALAEGREALKEMMPQAQASEDHAEALLMMQGHLDKELSAVGALPEAIDSVLKPIHDLAVLEGKKALLASKHPGTSKFEPSSQWLADLIAGESDQERALRQWQNFSPAVYDTMLEARHLRGIVDQFDRGVDDMAMDMLTAGVSVKVLDAFKAYVATVRRELGKALVGTELYDEQQFLRLRHIEDKCTLAQESHYALKPMVMNETNNGYDDCYLRGIATVMADTGTRPDRFDEHDYKWAEHLAEGLYVNTLKGQDLYERHLFNPYIPALLTRCQYLVAQRDLNKFDADLDPVRLDAAARVMLTEVLDSMPRDPNDRGRTKQIVMDASALRKKLAPMEREAERLGQTIPSRMSH